MGPDAALTGISNEAPTGAGRTGETAGAEYPTSGTVPPEQPLSYRPFVAPSARRYSAGSASAGRGLRITSSSRTAGSVVQINST